MRRTHCWLPPNRWNRPIDPRLLEVSGVPADQRRRWSMIAPPMSLISRKAGLAYPIRDGIPIMLPEEARKLEE